MDDDEDQQEDLVAVFVPALAAILIHAEDEKDAPLTYDEVLSIRDGAACIMMTPDKALHMDETRGYCDIDPENCWYEWQMLRRELGRQPELDAGAKVRHVDSSDSIWQQSVEEARDSLDHFRQLLADIGSRPQVSTMIKTRLSSDASSVLLWLHHVQVVDGGFVADVFELPSGFDGYDVGDEIEVAADCVLDWAVNDQGTLRGGFSLRATRESLSEDEQQEFDDFIGVTNYA